MFQRKNLPVEWKNFFGSINWVKPEDTVDDKKKKIEKTKNDLPKDAKI